MDVSLSENTGLICIKINIQLKVAPSWSSVFALFAPCTALAESHLKFISILTAKAQCLKEDEEAIEFNKTAARWISLNLASNSAVGKATKNDLFSAMQKVNTTFC